MQYRACYVCMLTMRRKYFNKYLITVEEVRVAEPDDVPHFANCASVRPPRRRHGDGIRRCRASVDPTRNQSLGANVFMSRLWQQNAAGRRAGYRCRFLASSQSYRPPSWRRRRATRGKNHRGVTATLSWRRSRLFLAVNMPRSSAPNVPPRRATRAEAAHEASIVII